MSIQTILQDLKTIKISNFPITTQTPYRKVADVIISSATQTTTTTTSILSTLTSNTVKLILSDPNIKTRNCLSLFNVISENRSLLPFKLEIEHYVTLICRAIKSRKFEDAENIINSLANDGNFRYSFSDVVSFTENQRFHAKIISKMFNLMLKVNSDSGNFIKAFETFNYMRNNGIEIDERTCSVYLIALMKCEHLGLGLVFYYKMVECGIDISVYSVTVVVNGLCKNGQIKKARELVEDAVCRSVKPNVITFNTLIDACCKRWNFEELDLVLVLMKYEGVEFNLETYKFLIDGFLSNGKINDAERMIMEMHDKDLNVEIFLWNSIIHKYCRLGKMDSAFQVFDKMLERNIVPNTEMYRIMVSGICGIGEIDSAKDLADQLQKKDVDLGYDVFDDLINGCCKKGKFNDAVKLLSTMEKKGLYGDMRLYNTVIVGLCEVNRVDEAKRLLSVVVKCGVSNDFIVNLIKDPIS